MLSKSIGASAIIGNTPTLQLIVYSIGTMYIYIVYIYTLYFVNIVTILPEHKRKLIWTNPIKYLF